MNEHQRAMVADIRLMVRRQGFRRVYNDQVMPEDVLWALDLLLGLPRPPVKRTEIAPKRRSPRTWPDMPRNRLDEISGDVR